jgi:hypothetical protein
MKNVAIIAGGPSILNYDLKGISKYLTVIGVNQSFINIDECHCGITMDRLWFEHNFNAINESGKPFFVRPGAAKNLGPDLPKNITLFDCNVSHEMSFEKNTINGTSSGMCALNLALKMDCAKIYLLGFDMHRQNGVYWHNHYSWASQGGTSSGKYKEWTRQFDEIAKKYARRNIYNVNHVSALKGFPVLKYKDFIHEIQK